MQAGNRRGQHTAEFVVLIGLAAVAAVAMQTIVRRSLQQGLQHASDTMLPPQPEDDDHDTQHELTVRTANQLDEEGDGQGKRTTAMHTSVVGHSVNEDVRLTGSHND